MKKTAILNLMILLSLFAIQPVNADSPSDPSSECMMPTVKVTGKKYEKNISTTTLTAEEILSTAGSANDPLRAAHVVPALSIESDFDTRLLIRGSAPEDSQILIDGIPAGFPFHFFGLASTIDPNILKEMKICAGGFPVDYGNYMGGIIDLRSQTSRMAETGLNLNLMQAGFFSRMPLWDHGSVQGSFRRGFYNLVLRNWSEAVTLPAYNDYFFKAVWDSLTVYSWGSEDSATLKTYLPTGPAGISHLQQTTASTAVRYQYQNENFDFSTLGQYYLEGQNYSFDNSNFFEQNPKTLNLRMLAHYVGLPNHRLMWGSDFAHCEPHVNIRVSDFFDLTKKYLAPGQSLFISDNINYQNYAAYLSDGIDFTPEFNAELGMRWDYTSYNHLAYWAPRGQLDFEPNRHHHFRAAIGVYDQEPIPMLLAAQSDTDPLSATYNQAIHYILSYQLSTETIFQQTVEFYYKDFLHLNTLSDNQVVSSDGRGYARGLEYKLQMNWTPKCQTLVTYSWSESKRYLPEKGDWIFFDNDRTHQLAIWQQLRMTPNFEASAHWALSSGQPFSPVDLPSAQAINSLRLPPYQRLDLRLGYRQVLDGVNMELNLDIINLYNADNYSRIVFNNLYASTTYFKQFPFLVVFGLSVKL